MKAEKIRKLVLNYIIYFILINHVKNRKREKNIPLRKQTRECKTISKTFLIKKTNFLSNAYRETESEPFDTTTQSAVF